jgi:hypothetical protein
VIPRVWMSWLSFKVLLRLKSLCLNQVALNQVTLNSELSGSQVALNQVALNQMALNQTNSSIRPALMRIRLVL